MSDFSVNPPQLPLFGAQTFGGSSAYAAFVLLQTIPASVARTNIDIENLSGGQLLVLLDDGQAGVGLPLANASLFSLGGSSAGQQGASWSSSTFKGRVQLWAAAATAQVATWTDGQ